MTQPIPTPPETPATSDAAILNLAPALVDPSFIADRMEPGDASYRALLASIADRGQIAPILVRPHPAMPGRYQVACGHRRLRAASELGRATRAILRPLSTATASSRRARTTARAQTSASSSALVSRTRWSSGATGGTSSPQR